MKTLAVVIIGIAGLFSCSSEDPSDVVVDLTINLSIQDSDGQDLLNPAIGNFIQEEDISIYYEVDGAQKPCWEVNGGVLDNPKGFSILTPHASSGLGSQYVLSVFSHSKVGRAVTVIKIEGHDEIKLAAEVVRTNGNILITKIWHNEVLVWTADDAVPKHVAVILN